MDAIAGTIYRDEEKGQILLYPMSATYIAYYRELCPNEPRWIHEHLANERVELEAKTDRLRATLVAIRALKPVRMGDHWAWEYGLKPDDVHELIDEALGTPSQ